MSKRTTAIAVAALLAVAAAWFASPWWTVWQMQSAARAGEGDRLAQYVDFPALREDLKSQVQTGMAKKLQRPDMQSNPFAGLGMMLAGSLLGGVVDALVTPDNLASMIRSGRTTADKLVPPTKSSSATEAKAADSKPPRIAHRFEGLNVFKVEMHEPDTDKLVMTWVLTREGFLTWKLTSIRLAAFAEMG